MRAPRIGTLAVMTLVLVTPLSSCTKNRPGTNVKLADEGEPVGAEAGATESGESTAVSQAERGSIEKIQVMASVAGLGDMLDGGTKLLNMWMPPEPGAPTLSLRTEVADMLLDSGFGPGFFESLELDAVHAAAAGIPHGDQPGVTDADLDVAAVFTSTDGQRTLDGLPGPLRPQPLGDGLWQLIAEGMSVFFRPKADSLEIAVSRVEQLDVATGLRAQAPTGPDAPRVNVSVTNIPPVDIDISELLPLPDALARPVSAIINDLDSAQLAADFGTDRALMVRASANAPFERLGLDPIGPAATQPSELAKALPGDALGAWLMPWGDPKLLHEALDRYVPVDQIPAPFDGYVSDVMGGSHELLDLMKGEVLATAYVDQGKLSLVLAGEVKDEGKARKATRALFDAATKALGDHIALVGGSADHKYSVSFKRDAIKVGNARGDLFKVTIPKNMHDDVEELSWFVGAKKPQLELASIVVDGKLIVVIGAGQKAIVSKIGKRGDGLEGGGGLALARKLSDGCQYCMFVDPVETGELFLTVIQSSPDEAKQVRDAAKKALAALAKLGLDGELALGLRLSTGQGMLGLGVPKELLFADPAKIKTVVELFESLDEAEQAAWESVSEAKSR